MIVRWKSAEISPQRSIRWQRDLVSTLVQIFLKQVVFN